MLVNQYALPPSAELAFKKTPVTTATHAGNQRYDTFDDPSGMLRRQINSFSMRRYAHRDDALFLRTFDQMLAALPAARRYATVFDHVQVSDAVRAAERVKL